MNRWMPVAVALALLLAGCSDKPAADPLQDTSFDDLEVQATATTGVVRGIVVDDRIAPVVDARISLSGTAEPQETTTDDQGRFAFDQLQPGTYFLSASHLLYTSAQTTVDVVAGVNDPPITKVQLARRFSQDPFHEQYKHDGFIQCNQSGVYYGSAPCVTDFTGIVAQYIPDDQKPCVNADTVCCKDAGCAPQLRRIQEEDRGFTVALNPGWQALVWDMTWDETSDTFARLGVTVSFNETERCACHNFASYGSASPLNFRIDVGVDFEPSNSVEPELIPPEGLPAMYYFVGARSGGGTMPAGALVLNQQFQLISTFFYYGVPPEGWSFVNDPLPF